MTNYTFFKRIIYIFIVFLIAICIVLFTLPEKKVEAYPTDKTYQLIELEKQQLRELQEIRKLLERKFRGYPIN